MVRELGRMCESGKTCRGEQVHVEYVDLSKRSKIGRKGTTEGRKINLQEVSSHFTLLTEHGITGVIK